MTEPDVTLTDYLLAVESLVLAAWLIGQPATRPDLRLWFVVFFLATALASALGGTVHGFFVARPSRLGRRLWRATLLSIGVAAAANWVIGSAVLWPARPDWILALVAAQLVGYAVVVTAVNDAFWVAAANYAPSTVFLIVACALAYQAGPNRALAIGLTGLALSLLAGVGQRLRIGIHPAYFNHNAVFHVLHGLALFMISRCARYLMAT